jgi:hypothetical protein
MLAIAAWYKFYMTQILHEIHSEVSISQLQEYFINKITMINVTFTKHCNTTSPWTWNNSANSPSTTSRSLELLMRCHEFRYASSLCISDLFQHEYRSPNLHLPLLGPLQLLWFTWSKSIQHITTAKNTKHWLSAIVTRITPCQLMVICFYIPACNVQTTGFPSLMLLSNSLPLSPSIHNWCSIHSQWTSVL